MLYYIILYFRVTHVTFSSVCPRVSPGKPTLSENMDNVNTGIPVFSQEDSVTLVDNDQATHTINDRLLTTDGVHLTRQNLYLLFFF